MRSLPSASWIELDRARSRPCEGNATRQMLAIDGFVLAEARVRGAADGGINSAAADLNEVRRSEDAEGGGA